MIDVTVPDMRWRTPASIREAVVAVVFAGKRASELSETFGPSCEAAMSPITCGKCAARTLGVGVASAIGVGVVPAGGGIPRGPNDGSASGVAMTAGGFVAVRAGAGPVGKPEGNPIAPGRPGPIRGST